MGVRFDKSKFAALAKARGLSPAKVLRNAGVSRNAYYNLLHKESLVPNSVEQIAEALGTSVDRLVVFDESAEAKLKRKMLFVQQLLDDVPTLDAGTLITTLKLLDLSPRQRLEQSLQYGKSATRFR